MIERHIAFHILSGREQEFVDFVHRAYFPAIKQTPGFISAELLQSLDDREEITMVLRFDSQESSVSWRGSRAHEYLKPELKSYYSDSQLRIFDVID